MLTLLLLDVSTSPLSAEIDFATQVHPILHDNCIKCHGPTKVKGDYRLDSRSAALKNDNIIPGDAANSYLIEMVVDGEMPEKGPPLSDADITTLRHWIDEGAVWDSEDTSDPALLSETTPAQSKQPYPAPQQIKNMPPSLQTTEIINYQQDIHPIFERSCLQCHGSQRAKSRYRMDTREDLLKGGRNGVAVVPGDSAHSALVRYISHLDPDFEMPPLDEGAPLSNEEIALVRTWIDQGAHWPQSSSRQEPHLTFESSGHAVVVDGNENLFRKHHRLQNQSVGIDNLQYEHSFNSDTALQLEGSFHTDGPIDLSLNLQNQDWGFVRGGFEYYQNFSNDTGGFFAPFNQPAISLDRDLLLKTGRAWTQFGLERDGVPRIVIGYEYLFKDGDHSTLIWGPTSVGGATRNIFPSFKSIDEDIHRITLDMLHEQKGLSVENNFVAEFLSRTTERFESDTTLFASPNTFALVHEEQESIHFANYFSVHKKIYDWWRVSAGHHYSLIDSDATFERRTVDADLNDKAFGSFVFTSPITLSSYTHALNANTLLGPWKDLTLTLGLQGNFEEREAFGTTTTFFDIPTPTAFSFSALSNTNRQSVRMREHATLRFTGLPRTTLYAEAYLEQENIELFEEELQGSFITRETHTDSNSFDYRLGATIRPLSHLSTHLRYRYTKEDDDHDHLRDEVFGFANLGYPAFINQLTRETHEIKARLNIRPRPWLSTNLAFQYITTDYNNETDATLTSTSFLAGEYDSQRYSLNVVLTRWQRLSLYSNISFQYMSTRTNADAPDLGDSYVADYEGKLYSAQIGGQYQMKNKTLLSGNYSFSKADFTQSSTASSLPLGIDYDQHTLQLGIKRKLTDNVTTELRYHFYYYDEPSNGGSNDYSAHGLFLNFRYDWL